ncbi:GTP pyrophosphokinase [Clostridium grantii]|uniref:Putative GTP pyrophosphokinase n=1 Tax=Clostridium grantii DSM 8605 TaxID=1121316 RepID=A0A1M5Y168_9CLOT|nr:RelA/SpoT domain protein [Clostridium grantii]SHI05815.1 putative GTP pyrophosphokinase [Clostridium grantii DSM 8605]
MGYSMDKENSEFYKDELNRLISAEEYVLDKIEIYRETQKRKTEENPIEHCKSRIKSSKSVKNKLLKKGLEPDLQTALDNLTDIVGIRIVCGFMDSVYQVVDFIKAQREFEIIKEKDYISNPKPNGYRSYHLIVKLNTEELDGVAVEIQIRTIALDCWASLEHQIKYKHTIKYTKTIEKELKRCADEIASVDLTMQTIREVVRD